MYHDHFGFYTAPFSLSTHLHFVFKSGVFEETMAHLVYGLDGGEDIILITGEIGTGKTLALNNLTEHVSSRYAVCLINVTQVDFRELLKLMLSELGIDYPANADRADLLTALKAELVALQRQRQRLLLIIDEAQNLDLATLEGIRLLTNLGPVNEQVIQVVMSGQPTLRTKIDMPELAQVRQRIRVHYHLDTLTEDEVGQYINHRLQVAGCDRELFRKEALTRIHALSGGVPRLINILADRALLAAFVEGRNDVVASNVEDDEGLVRSPAEESQQAARAAQASEQAPPLDEEPDELVVPVVDDEPEPFIEDEDLPVDEPEIEAVEDTDDDDDDEYESMIMARPRKSRGGLLAVIAPVLILILAVVIFWPYIQTFVSDLIDGTPPQETLPVPVIAETDTTAAESDSLTTALVDPTAHVDSMAIAMDDTLADPIEDVPDRTVALVSAEMDTTEAIPEPQDETEALRPEFVENALAGPVVHVGSFQDSLRAEVLADRFREEDYPVHVRLTVVNSVDWFRVYVGPWPTSDAAHEIQTEITEAGLVSWSMVTRIRQ
jgi:type II secretory pathway predicted ATPase ExeA/cell division septation protein DedD